MSATQTSIPSPSEYRTTDGRKVRSISHPFQFK
ncbi:hypothetical protein M080_4295, partial [Bacteroides fragilis str. 3397 T10]